MSPTSRQISKACTTCKTRRIKCDEARPVCQRCIRSGRQCAYATDFDLVHRDETRRTERRFARSNAAAAASSSSGGGDTTAQAPRRRLKPASSSESPPSNPPAMPTTFSSSAATATPALTTLAIRSGSPPSPPRGDSVALLMSAAAMETTIFVSGEEVDEKRAAAAAAVTASGFGPLCDRQRQRLAAAAAVPDQNQNQNHHRPPPRQGDTAIDLANPHPSAALTMPVGELALCYFAANFMFVPRSPHASGFFEFIVPVLRNQAPDSPLLFALRACSFAALGNRWVSSTVDFSAIAISQYTAALAKTTLALKDAQESTTDATLATVLLLGLFENITTRKEMVAWRSHIEGAVHIAQSRGAGRLRTETEQLLFNSVRLQLIAHALSAETPPDMSVHWWLGESVIDSASARCERFALEASQLRIELSRQMRASAARRPADLAAMRTLLLRIQAIDNEMATWMAAMPAQYRYYTVALAGDVPDGRYDHAESFPGRVDAYPDLAIANAWNITRSCRLILASLILRCAAFLDHPADYRTGPAYPRFVRVCTGLISDILASVPFYLGTTAATTTSSSSTDHHLHHRPARHAFAGFACGDEHGAAGCMPKALAGMLLIWPLASVASHDCTTKAQRAYIAGRLRIVGDELGLRYAHFYAAPQFYYPSWFIQRDQQLFAQAARICDRPDRCLPNHT